MLVQLRTRSGAENQQDAILNVMDALTGWCHPAARLVPDDGSLAASGAAPEKP